MTGEVAGQATKGFFDLGVVGASLFIIVVFIVLMMWFMNKLLKKIGTDTNVTMLCSKIDTLVTVINTQQVATYKDMKNIIDLMNRLLDCTNDIQRRVVRVDDRTYACRGNIEKSEHVNIEKSEGMCKTE